MPTAAELAGVELKSVQDGRSVVNLLKGGEAPKREAFYWELHEGTSLQAVRFGNWKAVRNGPSKPIELYDLATDLSESKDLAKEKVEVVAKAELLMKSMRVDSPDWPLVDKREGKKKKRKEVGGGEAP
jgi:arylsulfatase A-like enzyme